ncbi:MAG: hypothetical protein H0X12_16070 [Nocardioides sp.]|nr:hypothetical protein [Nocardioides sp.]
MIGYYVHHHGSGHLHRATTVARSLTVPVTGISSLPKPGDWPGEWLQLPRDDEDPAPRDPTAGGRLHWVPLGDPGLTRRMHLISEWVDRSRPRTLVVDASVEVALLARLHGVPVVGVVSPGRRHDEVHRLGLDICAELVAAWPAGWTERLLPGLPDQLSSRIHAVGGLSRFPVGAVRHERRSRPRVALLAGTGGDDFTRELVTTARQQTPHWDWTVMSRHLGTWNADPRAAIADADLVLTHAGQNAIAEVAAARRPAVVIPQRRPFDEQDTTAAVLRDGWPAVVADDVPTMGWAELLDSAVGLDGQGWERWCDGSAADRFASVILEVAMRETPA